jgi:hypothetical protein
MPVGSEPRTCIIHLSNASRRVSNRSRRPVWLTPNESVRNCHAQPHQGIEQRRPCEPADVIPLSTGRVERRDRLGGVLHEYSRAAA